MSEKIIKKIVELAFKKAEKNIAVPTKKAICVKISEAFEGNNDVNSVTYKTIERVYDKYVVGKKGSTPKNETIDYLCIYLGYNGFSDFIKTSKNTITRNKTAYFKAGLLKKAILFLSVIAVFSSVIFFTFYRSIVITTNQKKDIVLFVHKNNKNKKIGILSESNNYTLKFWHRIGTSELYFYEIGRGDGEEYPGAELIEVKPFWKPMEYIVLSKI